MITKNKDKTLDLGLQQLQSQHYENANHTRIMKTQKEMYKLKKRINGKTYWLHIILQVIT